MWVCVNCEADNDPSAAVCDVCDTPRNAGRVRISGTIKLGGKPSGTESFKSASRVPALSSFIAFLALLAVESGILSTYVDHDPWGVTTQRPILPGAYFALVMVAGVCLWETKRIASLLTVFTFTVVGWLSAYEIAVRTQAFAASAFSHTNVPALSLAIAGLAGGLVGSSVTLAGLLIVSPASRRRSVVLLIVLLGTLLGLLLVFLEQPPKSLVLLFVCWQTSVAGCVAFAICAPKLSGYFRPAISVIRPKEAVVIAVVALGIGAVGFLFEEGNKESAGVNTSSDNEEELETYLSTCSFCARRTEVAAQVNVIKEKRAEEELFRAAVGDLAALNTYLRNCHFCMHSDEALAAVVSLQAAQARREEAQRQSILQQEEAQYAAARGDVARLRAYINSCQQCQFREAAVAEADQLEQATSQFDFTVCNKSGLVVSVAVSYFAPINSEWMVEGWWTVANGQCSKIGRFQKGDFYHYVKELAGDTEWVGTFGLCVAFPGPFQYVNRGAGCSQHELKLFATETVRTDTYTVNLLPAVRRNQLPPVDNVDNSSQGDNNYYPPTGRR